MKRLNKIVATSVMMSMLLIGTHTAKAGILVAGLTNSEQSKPCTQKIDKNTKGIIMTSDFTGILVAGFTGILVAGFTGILIAGATNDNVDCGILVAG